MIIRSGTVYIISSAQAENFQHLLAAIDLGADVVQLRDKKISDQSFYCLAEIIRKRTKERNVLFIINDRVDIAKAVDADGVHLGKDDIPIEEARRILGRKKIIGFSTHNYQEAKIAFEKGADYISVGPIFKTSSKPELNPIAKNEIALIMEKIYLPKIAIGGINLDNMKDVVKLGFDSIAVLSSYRDTEDKKSFIIKAKEILETWA